MILRSIQRVFPYFTVYSGMTAAWLHGLSAAPCQPAEVSVPEDSWLRSRRGLAIVRTDILPNEIVECGGFTCTSRLRTVTDIGRRARLEDAVPILDEALHRKLVDQRELDGFARANRGRKGIARLRTALGLVEAATESPMETRLRLVLVLGGLPPPSVQVPIRVNGQFVARPDLLYEAQRLALEYDGEGHRDQLTEDNRRQNRLIAAGYRVLRFTSDDLRRRRDAVVAQVRAQLAA